MILQYFKKKENEYKKFSDNIYLSLINVSKDLIRSNYFKEKSFDTSFEITSIILIFYLKILKGNNDAKSLSINELLIKNFISDLDKSLRELGIGDMSIGKYVKKYVKKLYYRIKIIDPMLDNFDGQDFVNHLKSIKSTDHIHIGSILDKFIKEYERIEKNHKKI